MYPVYKHMVFNTLVKDQGELRCYPLIVGNMIACWRTAFKVLASLMIYIPKSSQMMAKLEANNLVRLFHANADNDGINRRFSCTDEEFKQLKV